MRWCDEHADFIIAVATVFMAVLTAVLAYVAIKQTDVATQALELNSRPYISITLYPQSIFVNAGNKLRMEIGLRNSGAIPATVRIKSVITYSPKEVPSPSLNNVEDGSIIFPKDSEAAFFIYSSDPITEGQFQDIKGGTGFMYVRVLVTYGLYLTEICDEYKIKESKNPGATFTFAKQDIRPCKGPNSTRAT